MHAWAAGCGPTMKVVAVTSCCTRKPAYEMATPFKHDATIIVHSPPPSCAIEQHGGQRQRGAGAGRMRARATCWSLTGHSAASL